MHFEYSHFTTNTKKICSSVAEKPQLEAIQKTRKLENVDLFTAQFDTVPIVNPTNPGTSPGINPGTNPGTNPTTPIVNPANSPPPPTTTMTPITNPTPSTTPPGSTGSTPPGSTGSTPPGSTTPGSTPPGSTAPGSSGGQWCIANPSASETSLQVALDYACGYGGADCSQIQPGGSCYNPSTLHDHASFAFNDYYHKNPSPTSCVFGGAAQLTSTDPSSGNCHYPSSTGTTSPTPPAMANPPPSPTTTNPYTTPTTPDITTPTSPDSTVYGSAEPTGLPSSATSLSCGLILLAATGFIRSLLAENYV
ncbi:PLASMODESMATA CALLOSE-BINDING PROTEIN 1 isoform X2 [Pistacia vera]|uniref:PLASMODESMATA CALLOSE-BINDING PROTEIN 1 isoform X2 n=1 Tax=Pistacia vera TaxID=55513 RepID=UPI001263608F|nr:PLASMODESMATA CALLOSE-BINDING PROTEIN 1 isoform X2 [Pistacia vera]